MTTFKMCSICQGRLATMKIKDNYFDSKCFELTIKV